MLDKYWSVSAAAGYTLQIRYWCHKQTELGHKGHKIKTFSHCCFSTVTSMAQHLSTLTWVNKFSHQWHLPVSLLTSSVTSVCICVSLLTSSVTPVCISVSLLTSSVTPVFLSLFAAQLWRAADAENPALWLAERLCSVRPPDGLKQLFKWRVYIYKEKDVYSPFNISMYTGSKKGWHHWLCVTFSIQEVEHWPIISQVCCFSLAFKKK